MKKWKSVVSAVLAGMMILSTVISVGAANVTFTDTSSHWAKTQINYLVSKNVLNGYEQSNGTYIFKPDGTVTRAEFIKMLDETFGLTATAGVSFTDVKPTDWFHPYFSKAAAQGYLLNYGTTVSPNGQLTREEATTLLVRYLDLLDEPKADASSFTDYSKISDHFKEPVMIAVKAGLINGYQASNGTYYFDPQKTLTRAEALTILYRAAGAIYNTSAYSRDSAAPATNATITRGGVTLSGMNLNGRVIVTEGAAGDAVTLTGCHSTGNIDVRGASSIILNDCTIESLTVDAPAAISINLSDGTVVNSLTLDSKANMNIATGCSVNTMVVNSDAKNVDIRGNGAISHLTVNAAGFISTMMPGEFYIANGLYATFASEAYSGSSDDQASFSMLPYMTTDDNHYYLNLVPETSGQVYYYYSNTSYAPSASEFNNMYVNATYGGSFYVNAGSSYAEKTEDANLVKRYQYVVVQLVSGQRKYAPVVLNNTPTSGTGFSVDPYFDGDDISFTADVSGTISYFYSSEGDNITIANFEAGYRDADSAMRGTLSATANRSGYISLTERYLENYPFVVIVMQNTNGQYYNPVVVAAGDNGFSEEPEITTVGTISFKTSVDGTLYYYYSTEETMPTPNEVASNWRSEKGRASVQVTKNRSASINYNKEYTTDYPYMVFCIKDEEDNYLTPYVLSVDLNTGFATDPYVSATDEISFKTNYSGTVYWFFTKSSSGFATDEFMEEWSDISTARKGKVTTSRGTADSFEFDSGYAQQYPYIAIMLVDTSDKEYQPVLLDVKNTSNNGFTVAPYCDLSDKHIYFKASTDGKVYYYYTTSGYTFAESIGDFWESYSDAGVSIRDDFEVSDTLDYFSFDNVDSRYTGVMVMFVDKSNREYYPVYVSLTRDGTSGVSAKGVTLLEVTKTDVTFYVEADGVLHYSGYTDRYDQGDDSTKIVSKGDRITITHNGYYESLKVQLEGILGEYDVFYVDLTEDFNRDDVYNDGSTIDGSGFNNAGYDIQDGHVVFYGFANDDGYITFTMDGSTMADELPVEKGEFFMYVFDEVDLENMSTMQQFLLGTMYAQFTDSAGETYEKQPIYNVNG